MSHKCPECGADCDCVDVKNGEDCSHCEHPWDDEEHPDDEYQPLEDEKGR